MVRTLERNRLEHELERLGEKNVELAFQLVELENKLRATTDLLMQRESQLRSEYEARVGELEERLRQSEERARELEQRQTVATAISPETVAGRLARRLEPLLGAAAGHLVERIFGRAEVPLDCRELARLEPALARLEDAAGRLLATPERAEGVRRVLEEARQELRQAPVLRRAPACEPAPPPRPRMAARFAPVPAVEAVAEDPPWRHEVSAPGREEFRPDFDPELGRELALAREQVASAEYALALETLLPLRTLHPHSLEAAELHFLALAGLRRCGEALELGRRLAPHCRHEEAFVDAFTRVLEEGSGKSARERKEALLDLVELHLEDAPRALGYLRQAELLPDRFPGSERLQFHAVRLLGGRREDRRPYLLDSMTSVDRPELFELLWQVYSDPRWAHEASTARALVALGKVSRSLAENSEKQARLLGREPLAPLEGPGELEETACVRFLTMLAERASLGPTRPSADFLRRLEAGQTPEPGWLELPDWRQLGLEGLQVARCQGPEGFLVDVHRDESGQATLLVHERLAELPEPERAYLLHRALYQAARGHASVRHRRANLTVGHVRRLVQACRDWLAERVLELPAPDPDPVRHLVALCEATRSHEAGYLLELVTSPHPFADVLDRPADHFARRHSSLVGASYALLREHAPRRLAQVEKEGFRVLYDQPELRELRLRLQRMWAEPLKCSLRG